MTVLLKEEMKKGKNLADNSQHVIFIYLFYVQKNRNKSKQPVKPVCVCPTGPRARPGC